MQSITFEELLDATSVRSLSMQAFLEGCVTFCLAFGISKQSANDVPLHGYLLQHAVTYFTSPTNLLNTKQIRPEKILSPRFVWSTTRTETSNNSPIQLILEVLQDLVKFLKDLDNINTAYLLSNILIAIYFLGAGSLAKFQETYENASTEEISSDCRKESVRCLDNTKP